MTAYKPGMNKELHFFYWPESNTSELDLKFMKNNLPAFEQMAIAAAKSLKRQSELLRGRTLLRSVFRKIYDLDLPDKLAVSDSGKPTAHQGRPFNLSHSNGVLALVLGDSGELGVDVECDNSDRKFLNIVKNYGTEKEILDIESTEPSGRAKKFYAHWCLKESYSKATGQGLNTGLKDIEFNLEDNKFSLKLNKPACYFQYLTLGNHHASICHFSSDIFLTKAYEVSFVNHEFVFKTLNVTINTIT